MSRALTNFPAIVAQLKAILYRFLDHLQSIDACFIADDTLDTLAEASYLGQTRMAGLDLNKPRTRAVLAALVSLALSPTGFTASDLATKVRDILNLSPKAYQPRHAAYDLKKFRAKQWLRKIGSSRRYEATPTGLQTMSALLILREKVIKPVLAGAAKPKRGPKPQHPTLLDTLYHAIQVAMRDLFQALGVAV
jgi:hypothetical protein